MNTNKITGVVLAGGKSRRFGQDKGTFIYQGKTLTERALDIIRPACGQLLISTNNAKAYASFGLGTVPDIYPECGPLGGIHSALIHASHDMVAFIPCDTPFLPAAIYTFLLKHLAAHDLVIPVHARGAESTCSLWHKKSLPLLEQALEKKKHKILEAVETMDGNMVSVEGTSFYHPRIFHNINTKRDL